jgi:hypothetical protein
LVISVISLAYCLQSIRNRLDRTEKRIGEILIILDTMSKTEAMTATTMKSIANIVEKLTRAR